MAAQASTPKKLGTTSYAVLGLLALRDWTTYELAQQMERGIGRIWVASPSMVYEEPKHLVAHGYATVHDTPVGRRPRSRYSITDAGRKALAAWLERDPEPPALQFEGLLKILFSDQGGADTNTRVLAALAEAAHEVQQVAVARAQGYLEGDYIAGVDLDERAVVVAQMLAFLSEFYVLLQRWSEWAMAQVGTPDPTAAAYRTFARVAAGERALR